MSQLTQNIWRYEITCKCGDCDLDTIDHEIVEIWQDICDYFTHKYRGIRAVLDISSGCRCPSHNHNVRGYKNSQHLYGKAIDGSIVIKFPDGVYTPVTSLEIYEYVGAKFPNSLGLGIYDKFVHIDCREKRARW